MRHGVSVAILVAGLIASDGPSQKSVMALAGRQVAQLGEELPRLVATETFEQRVASRHPPGASASRRWVAEFAWVRLPETVEALGVRDVVEVDGAPVASRSRMVDLLHGPDRASRAQARTIVEEGARHNLAPGSRNFNVPTVALFFLHPEWQRRFKWTRRSRADASEWRIEFRERGRPTVIRSGGGPVLSRGDVSIDAATGVVARTELRLAFDTIRYTLITRFALDPGLGLQVPTSLEERWESPDQVVTGSATYSNYRRFETEGRVLR